MAYVDDGDSVNEAVIGGGTEISRKKVPHGISQFVDLSLREAIKRIRSERTADSYRLGSNLTIVGCHQRGKGAGDEDETTARFAECALLCFVSISHSYVTCSVTP